MGEIAVLTGDIVSSTDMLGDDLDLALDHLQFTSEAFQFTLQTDLSRFSRRAGDAWQCVISPPKYALRAALMLRAGLKAACSGAETRLAVSTGTGTLQNIPGDLNRAHGQAFIESGRLLENLSNHQWLAHNGGLAEQSSAILLDQISRGWTEAQSQALVYAFQPKPNRFTREKIARKIGKSRQAVDQALHAAGYPAVEAALALIEENHDAS